jgi:NADPH-dependent 2,4-dienoyl-CoA reductase/sulfur reductase-like enzyme
MSAADSGVVIIGGSVGGTRTAQALRVLGYSGRVRLYGADEHAPYDRPPLSKAYLAGMWDRSQITLLGPGEAERSGIEITLESEAVALRANERFVEFADGSRAGYEHLVIATGASARPSPWGPMPHVHVLRTLADADGLRQELLPGRRLVIVGAGFIGSEVASTARSLGLDVTLVDPLPQPLSRVLGSDVGERFIDLHTSNGVRTRFGTGVESLRADGLGVEVELIDGTRMEADVVVVGIGAVPNDGWLAGSGLVVDNGVVCDEVGRAVGVQDVFAVGDVARWMEPSRGTAVRLEHWTSAVEQAMAVAREIVNPGAARGRPAERYVWSDQYDWRIQVAGAPALATRSWVLEPDPVAPRFAVIYADEAGVLIGGATVNWAKAIARIRRGLASAQTARELEDALVALM